MGFFGFMVLGIGRSAALGFFFGQWAVAFSPRVPVLRVAFGDSHRVGRGLVARLWILLATGVVPFGRGWVVGQPQGCLGT